MKNHKSFGILKLVLGICLGFGIWCLGFSAYAWRITNDLKQEILSKQFAIKANPNDAHAHFDLAITYAYTNHIQEGWDELEKVEGLDSSFRQKGMQIYIKKVTEQPNDWQLRFRLAFAYYFNGQKKDALRELKNVLILDPSNVWAYGYLALIYGELGDVDSAMDWTRKGLKIDNQVAALHLLLAEGYNKKGDSWRSLLEGVEVLRLKALGY